MPGLWMRCGRQTGLPRRAVNKKYYDFFFQIESDVSSTITLRKVLSPHLLMSIPNYLNSTLRYIFLSVKVIKIAYRAPTLKPRQSPAKSKTIVRLLQLRTIDYLTKIFTDVNVYACCNTISYCRKHVWETKKSTERKWECRGLD